jgi:NAD-dependent SIR2 family protein deacetylase
MGGRSRGTPRGEAEVKSISPLTSLCEGEHRFVAFVGAGASALPPSNLPTWTEFNDLLLEQLCERLARYSDGRQPTDQILAVFRARRDGSRFFAPDFQAQLMEEEVGLDYFRVWQSLDTDVYGPVHAALAELAVRGRLAAIITTNFDRLIESALQERLAPFKVFHDQPSFDELVTSLDDHSAPLPVIKIHGSIEDTASLIDTLDQRVAGRPPSLMQAMRLLIVRHPWLYLGFSGADFSHNPHYLGILDAAADAWGFVFLVREGTNPLEGVRRLAEAYGPEKAAILTVDLSTWLEQTFGLDIPNLSMGSVDEADAQPQARVRDAIRRWANELGPIAVVNILCAMLTSSGLEAQAFWLLRKTWKSYRRPVDTEGKSYDRYNYNYGTALLNAGLIENPIALDDDMANLAEWKEHADQNAYEFLARAYQGQLLASGAQLAAVLAYRGELGKGIGLAASVTDEALAHGNKSEICDVAIASTPISDIVRVNPVPQLRHCVELAEEVGDELRRAMLCAHLGRFLTYDGDFAEAKKFLDEAERIGRLLDLRPVLLATQAARGRWLTDTGTSDEGAVRVLQDVASRIRALDEEPLVTKFDPLQPEREPTAIRARHPTLCRVLLDLNRAARFAGDADVMNETLDELDETAVEHFRGYCPHYYLAYAECLLVHGEGDQREFVSELIASARAVGTASENPWVAQAADDLERRRAQAET